MIIARRGGQVIINTHEAGDGFEMETVVLELSWNGLHWFRETTDGQLVKVRKLRRREEDATYVSGVQWTWDDELAA
jgi:hypothetical protein